MTQNQIAYWGLQEQRRHNKAQESLKDYENKVNLGLGVARTVTGLVKPFNFTKSSSKPSGLNIKNNIVVKGGTNGKRRY